MLLGFEQCQKRHLYSQDTDPDHSSSEPTTCLDRNQIKLEMKIPPEPLCASRPLGGEGCTKTPHVGVIRCIVAMETAIILFLTQYAKYPRKRANL